MLSQDAALNNTEYNGEYNEYEYDALRRLSKVDLHDANGSVSKTLEPGYLGNKVYRELKTDHGSTGRAS